MVSLFDAIVFLFPAANRTDFTVSDNGAGPLISYWNTAALGVQPSQATLDAVTQAQVDAAKLAASHATLAAALTSTTDFYIKVDRQSLLVILSEINILRGLIIGTGTVVWDPASMTNATGLTSANITVTGAAFGDFVEVAAPYSLAGITATAYVSAANTVNIRLHNGTGAAVNLASGTWNVAVRRDVAMPARTKAQLLTAMVSGFNAGDADS